MIWVILIVVFLVLRGKSSATSSATSTENQNTAVIPSSSAQSALPGSQPSLGQPNLGDIETVIPVTNQTLNPSAALTVPIDETPPRPAIDPIPIQQPGAYTLGRAPITRILPVSVGPEPYIPILDSVESVDTAGAPKPFMTPPTQARIGGVSGGRYAY